MSTRTTSGSSTRRRTRSWHRCQSGSGRPRWGQGWRRLGRQSGRQKPDPHRLEAPRSHWRYRPRQPDSDGNRYRRGGVWVAHGLLGAVSLVNPQFKRVVKTFRNVANHTTGGSVDIGGGSVWVAFADSTVARTDPSTQRVAGTGFAGNTPAGIAFGAGALWVANRNEATVYRFNPTKFESGKIHSFTVGSAPSAIDVGNNAVWVAATSDGNVWRIDPLARSVRQIPVGDGPTGLAYGAGAVWVANSIGGTVSRIDPATGNVVATIKVGNWPDGIAVGCRPCLGDRPGAIEGATASGRRLRDPSRSTGSSGRWPAPEPALRRSPRPGRPAWDLESDSSSARSPAPPERRRTSGRRARRGS